MDRQIVGSQMWKLYVHLCGAVCLKEKRVITQLSVSPQLQAFLTDIMDELGRQRTSTERVWNKMHKVKRVKLCVRVSVYLPSWSLNRDCTSENTKTRLYALLSCHTK